MVALYNFCKNWSLVEKEKFYYTCLNQTSQCLRKGNEKKKTEMEINIYAGATTIYFVELS